MNDVNETIPGKIVEDVVVKPGSPWGRSLTKGQHVRIIDLEGKQAVDFLCYDAEDPKDRYNASNTMKMGRATSSSRRGRCCGRTAVGR